MSKQRTKVPLKPGRSLVHWNQLCRTPAGQRFGSHGIPRPVTRSELAKHKNRDDCWMAVRGHVYNISPYMEYHPGGEDKLMKAAGRDGTTLFDITHSFVNLDFLMSTCLIGPLVEDRSVGEDIGDPTEEVMPGVD